MALQGESPLFPFVPEILMLMFLPQHYILRSKERYRELYHFDEIELSEEEKEAQTMARGMGGGGH
jgi:hypothetical protein